MEELEKEIAKAKKRYEELESYYPPQDYDTDLSFVDDIFKDLNKLKKC